MSCSKPTGSETEGLGVSKQYWDTGVLEPGEQGRRLGGEQDHQGLGHGGLKGKERASVYL